MSVKAAWKSIFDHVEKKTAEAQPEKQLFNPLGVHVNSELKIEHVDHIGQRYLIKELLEYDFGGGNRVSCYVARSADDERTIRLRLLREEGALRAVVCTLHDELDEEPGILGAVNDRGGLFVITRHDKGNEVEQYKRIGDMRTARTAKVTRLSDRNGDGEITKDELEIWSADCWDYSRTTKIDDVQIKEYLFVERTKVKGPSTARFRIWRGQIVQPDRLTID